MSIPEITDISDVQFSRNGAAFYTTTLHADMIGVYKLKQSKVYDVDDSTLPSWRNLPDLINDCLENMTVDDVLNTFNGLNDETVFKFENLRNELYDGMDLFLDYQLIGAVERLQHLYRLVLEKEPQLKTW